MTSSDWVSAIARWFLILSIVTATVVVSVRVLAYVGWWSLHATSLQVVIVATMGCVAVAGGRLLFHRFIGAADVTRRGIESKCPSADLSHQAQTSVASIPAGPADLAMPYEWSGVRPPPIPTSLGRVAATDTEEAMTGTASAPFELTGSMQCGSAEDRDRGSNPGARSGEPTPSSTEPPSPNQIAADTSADLADQPVSDGQEARPGDDALRLTEILNLYERIGFLPDDRDGEAIVGQDPDDGLPPQQGLWDELVNDYGAALIDFDAAGSGGCVITLDSGNMVFYDPDSERWAWVVFDHSEPIADLNGRAAPLRSVGVADEDADLSGAVERAVAD